MNKKISVLLPLLTVLISLNAQTISLKKGMTISRSVKIKKAVYQLDGTDSLKQPVLVIEGDNLVIDFNQSTLQGSSHTKNPDEFAGLAILVKSGKNITIKNLNARGYKVAIMARNIDGLKLDHCDLSYNYRAHLYSTQEKEDISDWLSHHQNEHDEWLRYGTAIYMRGCNNAIISYCKVTGGQNALMMMECNNATIYNNDFSFNSGLGIGMYKSSNNRVLYNRIDFDVRGYSDGVYYRGQDSAGILVYEQSNGNLFYKNSVTHGGDGFFLWAGKYTMDTGKGGCNDNRIIDNDFSYAPTNGVEVTFSRNLIKGNRIFECDNGIWGGYSFNTIISGNQFRNNKTAIAIEHGLHNQITDNIFYQDKQAISLWSNLQQSPDWVYGQTRDTRSAGYLVALNSFNNNPVVFTIKRTDSIQLFSNTYNHCAQIFKTDSTVTHFDSAARELIESAATVVPAVKNPMDPFKGNAKRAGKKNIMITEWGPYDFRYPLIWNTNPVDTSSVMKFDVLGPKGKWKVLSSRGVQLLPGLADSLPTKFEARRTGNTAYTDILINAEYTGNSFTDQFGNRVPGGKPYRFSFKKFFLPVNFQVKFYGFDSLLNPVKGDHISEIVKTAPFKTEEVKELSYAWWGGIKAGDRQYTQFLTLAEGEADVPPGTYELNVTWDDAIRVYVDGKMVIDEWNPALYHFDEAPHKKLRLKLGGRHSFRVEHVELGDFATLGLKLNKLD